ncbi:hypothetical protein A3841_19635 [Pontibacter flavimaris]|uniref:Uncharacterized protein n=1 Tax=Pontibacter flavimaris TaxID=1797110 RepID=A0A1Q5PE57_9BACT|nr:hypothetical protein A3841_19635 [Pontibacter flavimaris]
MVDKLLNHQSYYLGKLLHQRKESQHALKKKEASLGFDFGLPINLIIIFARIAFGFFCCTFKKFLMFFPLFEFFLALLLLLVS